MIENIEITTKVEEIPEEKKFKVTIIKVDKADADSILQNITQINESIKSQQEELNTIDMKVAQRKADTAKMMDQNIYMEKEFMKIEQKARLWKKEQDELNKRKAKEKPEAPSMVG
jgi:GTPase involved in cell partitioning and DNA repair